MYFGFMQNIFAEIFKNLGSDLEIIFVWLSK